MKKSAEKNTKVMVAMGKEQKLLLCLNGTNVCCEGEYFSVFNQDEKRIAYIKRSEVSAIWIEEERGICDGKVY